MKRRWLIGIAALWTARKAQGQEGKVKCKDGECNWVGPMPPTKAPYKPLPNQCPIPTCGTMAEPYDRGPERCLGADSNGVTQLDPCGPKERITRCKRCNNAFFQDAVN